MPPKSSLSFKKGKLSFHFTTILCKDEFDSRLQQTNRWQNGFPLAPWQARGQNIGTDILPSNPQMKPDSQLSALHVPLARHTIRLMTLDDQKRLQISELRKLKFVNTITWPEEAHLILRDMNRVIIPECVNIWMTQRSSIHHPIPEQGCGESPGQTLNRVFLSWHPWGNTMLERCFLSGSNRYTSTVSSGCHGCLRRQVFKGAPSHLPQAPNITTLAQGGLDFPKTSELLAGSR